jgi:hypothetical protein
MALTEKITCDHCGIVKGEANHWMLWDLDLNPRFFPWSREYKNEDRGHLCGESCAGKLLSKAIAAWRTT